MFVEIIKARGNSTNIADMTTQYKEMILNVIIFVCWTEWRRLGMLLYYAAAFTSISSWTS